MKHRNLVGNIIEGDVLQTNHRNYKGYSTNIHNCYLWFCPERSDMACWRRVEQLKASANASPF